MFFNSARPTFNIDFNLIHKEMATHILFSEGLQTSELTYNVREITKDWHLTCANFKSTYNECVAEGERQKAIASNRYGKHYCAPHYSNAPYGSIWDY